MIFRRRAPLARPVSGRFPFPDRPRLWGTAVSHYQVEGDDACDWTAWERGGRTRGQECGRAADSWNRYEEESGLARGAGPDALRLFNFWKRVASRERPSD